MDKLILKKIAKEWAKGILLATGVDSFDDKSLLSIEEQTFIVNEVHEIANRLTNEKQEGTLDDIIDKYYEENT